MELFFMPTQRSLSYNFFVSGCRTPRGLIMLDSRFCARFTLLPHALPIWPVSASAVPVLGVAPEGYTSVPLHFNCLPCNFLTSKTTFCLWFGLWTPFSTSQCTEWLSCSFTPYLSCPQGSPWNFSCLCTASALPSFWVQANRFSYTLGWRERSWLRGPGRGWKIPCSHCLLKLLTSTKKSPERVFSKEEMHVLCFEHEVSCSVKMTVV